MAGTRTAGTVNGTPTYKQVSISLIDAQQDIRTVSVKAAAGATDAEIEAYVAALQAATNASVYEVNVGFVYEGARLASNADDSVVNSVHSNIVYNARLDALTSQRGYIPAPIDTLFVPETDTPDPTQATLTAYFAAILAVLGAGYSGRSLRYTERREINDAVRF